MTEDRKQGHRIQIPRPKKPDPNRPLARYTDEQIDDVIKGLLTAQKTDQWELGKFLCEKKRRLGHGNFTPWVKEHFKDDFGEKRSHQTANNYMSLYRNIPDREAVGHIPLGTLYLIASDNFLPKLRQSILDKSEEVRPGLSKQEVKAALDAATNDEFDPEHPAVKELFAEHQAREAKAEQTMRVGRTLNHWQKPVTGLRAALGEGLPEYFTVDGIPGMAKDQADSELVRWLEKHGLMPDYRVFDNDE